MAKRNLLGWFLGLTVLCGIVVCVVVLIFMLPAQNSSASTAALPAIGALSPSFTLRTIQGEALQLEQFRGRPVIINFWATWCAPCKEEMPALQSLYQRYAPEGLVLLGVNHKGTLAEVGQFGRSHDLTFPLLLDIDGAVTNQFGVNAFPTTLFIDEKGYVQRIQVGSLETAQFEQYLQEIVVTGGPTATLAPSLVPTRAATLTRAAPLTLEGCVTTSVLNGRAGPGKEFTVMMGFSRGRCLTFDGRSADSNWLRLLAPTARDGHPLWVSAEFIRLEGDISTLLTVE